MASYFIPVPLKKVLSFLGFQGQVFFKTTTGTEL
jgi:hypothetical protein